MRISEVPPHAWSDTLDAFTAAHEGWLVSIATFGGADEEPRTEIANLPLIGISADRIDHGDIAISVARSPAQHVTHVIEHAAHVYLQPGHNGSTASLMIESDEGTRTILRVRAAAAASRGAA
ncbi:MAG TPA: DUF5335 family protein [Vicinamibacterales bacterium]|nr:DUF5335 family protein [Vicinamibacterales bacterium]